ncbi:MAG: hypothetical protein CYPHOPRED_005845 [Cyphobasidiales sp. Tagirdzhanova-0007]|nr:MAG: hypothetical protein CYPHOPRED_005845 [Cyphobasidiales sp. Tagirdzhanova-0007]
MRLLTHNLLACHARTCNAPSNFPLHFKNCSRVEIIEAEYNSDFLKGFRSKIEWGALVGAAKELGDTSLPEQEPTSISDDGSYVEMDDELLKKLHHVLLEIHVQDGSMLCPSCAHVYAIKDGIPNMLLAEHEIRSVSGQDTSGPLPYDPDATLPQQVQQSFRRSLEELGTEYIDSVLLHSPERTISRSVEALSALKPFIESGQLKHIGISNICNLEE